MEDKLKQFIATNREKFDEEALPAGHFERFDRKLPVPKKNRVKTVSLIAFTAAACMALLFILQLPFGFHGFDSSSYVCETKQEIEEVQLYYQMQMNAVIEQMEALYEQDRTSGAAELLMESKKVLLETKKFEDEVMPTLPCSDEGIVVLNQHYGNSLGSMHIMLEYMEQVTDNNVLNKMDI